MAEMRAGLIGQVEALNLQLEAAQHAGEGGQEP